MSISKGWNWNMVKEEDREFWKNPSVESYYLCNRWKSQEKKDFLDLGCGMGRHSILFGKNDFRVKCFDISSEAIESTRKWADEEGLAFEYTVGDMLELPYEDNSIDCIMCRNVISHSDTKGVIKAISEIKRVLRPGGECFLTLASKETWSFKQTDWPMLDENTRVRMDDGPEKGIPHFYADYDQTRELFKEFTIVSIEHVEDYYFHDGKGFSSCHFHVIIRKND